MNRIRSLEDENYQLKVGLGVGLTTGMFITTGLAIASYIYFSQGYESLYHFNLNFSLLYHSLAQVPTAPDFTQF